METKLNIAEILKDKPIGTKLYTDAFGELSIEEIYTEDEIGITLLNRDEEKLLFYNDGKYNVHGEPILVPSKEMRDWSKFAWKKGDVLKNTAYERRVIFDRFLNDDYTYFVAKHPLDSSNKDKVIYHEECNCFTGNYCLESTNAAQAYINAIEEKLGGKLNMATLEIEPTQPEFKDGDILLYKSTKFTYSSSIFILDTNRNYEMRSYVRFNIGRGSIDYDMPVYNLNTDRFRYATEEEKQRLFSALAKEGKAWDAEKKQIMKLKPKWTPKTFDKVITRDFDDGVWSANIFSHMNSQGEYVSIGCVEGYAYCLPYNKETAKLIGTTNNAK